MFYLIKTLQEEGHSIRGRGVMIFPPSECGIKDSEV